MKQHDLQHIIYDALKEHAGEVLTTNQIVVWTGLGYSTVNGYILKLANAGAIDWEKVSHGRIFTILTECPKGEGLTQSRNVNSLTHCMICAVQLSKHPRCKACGILVGEQHASQTLKNGVCLSCHRSRHLRAETLEQSRIDFAWSTR